MAAQRIRPEAYDALRDALTHYYWYKPDLSDLLRSLFASEPLLLAGLDVLKAPKRDTARSIVARLRENEDRYHDLTLEVLVTLSGFDDKFPHLAKLDEPEKKLRDAKAALARVRELTALHRAQLDEAATRQAELRAAATEDAVRRTFVQEIGDLRDRFIALTAMADEHERGRALEPFLYEMFALYGMEPRGPYTLRAEQIDGAFTFDTDDYLLEARWRAKPAAPDHVRAFQEKVAAKTHRTSGLFLSMSGFTSGAVEVLNGRGTRLLLADGADLMAVLENRLRLDELLLRKRRHAAETGDPFLRAAW
jgi:hypothetical protein